MVDFKKMMKAEDLSKRDFLRLTATSIATIGLCAATWPFINSMNPAADTLAESSTEVDLAKISPGQSITVMWRGKPVFIRRRTTEEINIARNTKLSSLPDPQTDQERFPKNPEWLVVIGICTHLGCIPTERKNINTSEDGWLCPCHGSVYDISGRILHGPAPRNLDVPPYEITNSVLKIG